MKNLISLLLLSFSLYGFLIAQAPIPNGDFENWNGNVPQNWGTSDQVLQILVQNIGGVTQETNSANVFSGNSAALMTTKNVNIPGFGSQNIPGVASLGTLGLDFITFTPQVTGRPYSDRPDSIRFAYKYEAVNPATDTGAVIVTLTRFVNNNIEAVANAFLFLSDTSDYVVVTTKINYFTFFNPDTLLIQGLSASGQNAAENSKLWLDNMEFVGLDTAFRAFIRPFTSQEICEGDTFNFETDAIQGNTYEWFKNNSSTGVSTAEISATEGGDYFVKVTRNGQDFFSDTITLSVLPAPNVSLNLVDTVCVQDAPFILVGGTPAGGTFSGDGVSGGSFDPGANSAGNQQITYTFSDINDCEASATETIVTVLCTGIKIFSVDAKFNIYPNPSSQFLIIDVNDKLLDSKILIYDATGKVVRESLLNDLKTKISTETLSNGTYYLKVTNSKGETSVTANLNIVH